MYVMLYLLCTPENLTHFYDYRYNKKEKKKSISITAFCFTSLKKQISALTAVMWLTFKFSMTRYYPKSLFCLCHRILHLKNCKLEQEYKFGYDEKVFS